MALILVRFDLFIIDIPFHLYGEEPGTFLRDSLRRAQTKYSFGERGHPCDICGGVCGEEGL